MRGELYEYRFSDPALHAQTGQPWVRTQEGLYFPQVSLADFARGPLQSAPPSGYEIIPGPTTVHP